MLLAKKTPVIAVHIVAGSNQMPLPIHILINERLSLADLTVLGMKQEVAIGGSGKAIRAVKFQTNVLRIGAGDTTKSYSSCR